MTGSDGLTTYEQFKVLVKGLKSAYTNPSFLPDGAAIKVWYAFLKDLPYETLEQGIYRYILTNKFPPSIAEIREACTTDPYAIDWSGAWEQVQYVISRYGYYREAEAMEHLDEPTRRCVKRLGFQNLCVSENAVADRANFRAIFEAEQKKGKELAALSVAEKNIKKIEKTY